MAMMNVLTDTLGGRLRTARSIAGFGQDDMGEYVGASRPTVSKWERDITEPTVSQLILWARKTNQPVEAILDGLNVVCASRDSNPQPSDPSTDGSAAGFWSDARALSLAELWAELEAVAL